jgi:hypothetical protein
MKTINISDYTGEEMGSSLFNILVTIGSAHAVEEVEINHYQRVLVSGPRAKTPRYENRDVDLRTEQGYAVIGPTAYKSWHSVNGSMLLSDDRVIMCITSREGWDTFQSGENVTSYYILTPKGNEKN